jgi:hypothetical protein
VTKKQAQFAGKENVASKVVDITLDRASVLILLVHKPDLSALLVAQIACGLPPNQSGTIAFIDVVDVNLYWRGGTLKESTNEAMLGIVVSTSSHPPGRRLS